MDEAFSKDREILKSTLMPRVNVIYSFRKKKSEIFESRLSSEHSEVQRVTLIKTKVKSQMKFEPKFIKAQINFIEQFESETNEIHKQLETRFNSERKRNPTSNSRAKNKLKTQMNSNDWLEPKIDS